VYRGGFVGLLNPFSLTTGFLTLSLSIMQGSAWLALKTEGELQARARRFVLAAVLAVAMVWIGAALVARSDARRVFDNFASPLAWVGPLLTANVLFYVFLAFRFNHNGRAFLFTSLVVAGLAATAGAALYPNLVPAVEAARSLTVDNAHSSDTSLTIMLIVALIGMPIVVAYSSFIYWKFKGKVRIDEASY
jgi:cytochrome d ubiquinol oxidase subunit II